MKFKDLDLETQQEIEYIESLGTVLHVCNIKPTTTHADTIINPHHLDSYLNILTKQSKRWITSQELETMKHQLLDHYQQLEAIYITNPACNMHNNDWLYNFKDHIYLLNSIYHYETDQTIKTASKDIREKLFDAYPEVVLKLGKFINARVHTLQLER